MQTMSSAGDGSLDILPPAADSSLISSRGREAFITYKRRKYGKKLGASSMKDPMYNYEHKCCQYYLESVTAPKNALASLHTFKRDSENSLNEYCELRDQTSIPSFTHQCQNVFRGIITSDTFMSLCSLLSENFHGVKAENILNFSLIDSRMQNGEYERSTGLFASDIQQIWENLKKIGDEIVHLANSLSKISETAFQEQVGCMTGGVSEMNRFEETSQIESAGKDSTDILMRQVSSDGEGQITKLEESEACTLDKPGKCKGCGLEAAPIYCLICDGCEAVYHISCIDPIIGDIPTRNWYCLECDTKRKETEKCDSVEVLSPGGPHKNCVVCDRISSVNTELTGNEGSMGYEPITISSDSEKSWDIKLEEADMVNRWTRRAKKICRRCRTTERSGMELVTCKHSHCPYKFYHKTCLTGSEIELHASVWYCPSCLCRGCFVDKDDDKIVLCDGCDEAYHIYCMVPPRASIPRGKWYCVFCNIKMRMRGKKFGRTVRRGLTDGSVDVLLSAAGSPQLQ